MVLVNILWGVLLPLFLHGASGVTVWVTVVFYVITGRFFGCRVSVLVSLFHFSVFPFFPFSCFSVSLFHFVIFFISWFLMLLYLSSFLFPFSLFFPCSLSLLSSFEFVSVLIGLLSSGSVDGRGSPFVPLPFLVSLSRLRDCFRVALDAGESSCFLLSLDRLLV